MYDRNIGIKLALVVDFAKAAKQAAEDTRSIVKSFETIKTSSSNFDVAGVTALTQSLSGLTVAAKESAGAVGAINPLVSSLNTRATSANSSVSNLVSSMSGLASESTAAASRVESVNQNLSSVGRNARKTGEDVRFMAMELVGVKSGAEAAEAPLLRLTTSLTNLGIIRIDGVGRAFQGISSDAMRAATAIHSVEAALSRLNRALPGRVLPMLPGGVERSPVTPVLALPPGTGMRQPEMRTINSGPTIPMAGDGRTRGMWGSTSETIHGAIQFPPAIMDAAGTAIVSSVQRSLNSSRNVPNPPVIPNFPYANRVGGGGPGSGGTGGPPIPPYSQFNPGFGDWAHDRFGSGNATMATGRSVMRGGNMMQEAGFAGVINAAMVGGAMVPLLKSMTDVQDLMLITKEALKSAGATNATVKKFNDAALKASIEIGGDFRQNVSGLYPFISSLPTMQSSVNLNDAKQRKAILDTYQKLMKAHVADASSVTPISMYTMSLDVAATAHNLGFSMKNPEEVAKAYARAMDILTAVKNRTGSTLGQAAVAFKQVGPGATSAGISGEDLAAISVIGADSKILGSQLGNQLKRIIQRQSTDPKPLADLQKYISEKTHGQYNLSMYDDKGHIKGLPALIGEVVDVQKYHMDPKDVKGRMAMDTVLSGLYAAPLMGALVQFGFEHSKKPGDAAQQIKNFGREVINKPLEGARPGESLLDTSFRTRTDGNVKNEAQKVDNVAMVEAVKEFNAMAPDLISILHSVRGLIEAWSGLPAPVKKGAVEVAGFLGIISGVVGVVSMIGGNFVKLGGALIVIGGAFMRAREFIMLWTGASNAAIAVETALGVSLGSIIAVVGAVALGVGALVLAWVKDFDHIREHTNASSAQMKSAFTGWISWLEGLVGRFRGFIGGIDHEIAGMGTRVTGELNNIASEISNTGKRWMESGQSLADQFVHGVTDKFKSAVSVVKSAIKPIADLFPHSPPPDSSSPFAGQEESGRAYVTQYGKGFVDGVPQVVAMVRNGSQVIADASHGIMVDDYFLTDHHHKKAKTKKPHHARYISDAVVEIRNETIPQAEALARAIEASFARAGAHIKKTWIDLFDPKTGETARVFGDAVAYRTAAHGKKAPADQSVENARAYITAVRTSMQNDTAAQMAADFHRTAGVLQQLSLEAPTDHARRQIMDMSLKLENEAKAAAKRIDNALKQIETRFYGTTGTSGLVGGIVHDFTKVNSESDRFGVVTGNYQERLQNTIRMRKDAETPTKRELNNEMLVEIAERKALSSILTQEKTTRDELTLRIQTTQTQMNKLNEGDAQQKAIKDQLKTQLQGYGDQLDAVNNKITSQSLDIVTLNTSIDAYKIKITEAKVVTNAWADALQGAFDKALKSAISTMDRSAGNAVDSWVTRIMGVHNAHEAFPGQRPPKGLLAPSESPFQTAFADFFKTFTVSIVGVLLNSILAPKMAGFGAAGGGALSWFAKLFGGADPEGKKGPKKGSNSSASGSSGGSQDVVLRPQTGSTDLGTQIATATTDTAKQKDAVASSPVVGGPGAGNDSGAGGYAGTEGDQTGGAVAKAAAKPTFVQTLVKDATGAYMAYEGIKAGGITGALEAYSGTASLFSGGAAAAGGAGPYVAAAVAAYSLFAHHETAAQQPDISQPGYGAFVSDLNGAPGTFNGQVVQPDAPYNRSLGAPDLSQQLYAFLTNSQAKNGLNSTQIAAEQKLLDLAGGNANGLGIAGERQGDFTLGSGKSANVTDYESLVGQVQAMMTQFNSNQLQASHDANRLASSFTAIMLGAPSGFRIPGFLGGTVGGGSTDTGWRPDLRSIDPGMRRVLNGINPIPSQSMTNQAPAPITVSILENATITDGTDVVAKIKEAMPMIVNHVDQLQYQRMRRVNGYVSPTS